MQDQYQQNIKENLSHIHQRMANACRIAGREESSVRLLLATKTVPPEGIRVAIDLGEQLVGENRMQEFAQKADALADLQYERHFIGHLQTNKVKDALKYVSCIQSVDRMDLVQKLDQRLQQEGRSMNIMVQVNTSFEESKFGMNPDDVFDFIKQLKQYDTLVVKGFMTIGLFADEAELVRPSYRRLKEIRDRAIVEGLISNNANELSMGMSGDLEVAIQEGATMVRVGTAIFGKRIYADSYYWPEEK